MSKHTPGPWSWCAIDPKDEEWGACEVLQDGLDGEFVATHVCGVDNARLIAAAPDLLEALELVFLEAGFIGNGPDDANEYYCEHCSEHAQDLSKIDHEPGCLITKVRAAIAKAKGEQ